MNTQNSRSKKLLDKVFDHLDSIDVSKLTMSEMKDFLEVVQKCQFQESIGSTAALGFNYLSAPFNGPHGITGPDGNADSAGKAE